MTFKKVLLIGDSFCARRSLPNDWPVVLGNLLKCPIIGHGYGGNSWWTNYRELNSFTEEKRSTVLVIVHTEALRLPNDYKLPINHGVLHSAPGTTRSEVKDENLHRVSVDFYKSKLFSSDFYDWAQAAWVKELDTTKEFYATIHIPAFDSLDLSNIKNGTVLRPSPKIASLRALSNMEILEQRWFGPDVRRNHFSDHNNVKLAEAVASTIKQLGTRSDTFQYFDNLDQWDFTKVSFRSS